MRLAKRGALDLSSAAMAAQTTITLALQPIDAPRVRDVLEESGFQFEDAPYAFFRARGVHCIVTFYQKGKVVLQGRAASEWAEEIAPGVGEGAKPGGTDDFFELALAEHPKPGPAVWAGIDETGKGDYFGPLVVVAASIERSHVALLRELGVADSKKIADKKVLSLAKELKTFCPHAKVVIGPQRYNALYKRIGNLNRLLAWGHARALEDLLERRSDITYALSDQFAKDKRTITSQLMDRGKQIQFAQRHKAEADPAVAVASILARAEFLWRMRALEKEVGDRLPKGAGPPVLAAGKKLVAKHGPEVLGKVAKLHFRTTEQLGVSS
jgi:ribonuclease HIII